MRHEIGQEVQLIGTARDARLGAVVVLESGGAIYIDGLEEWPTELDRRKVEVRGILREKKLAPDPTVGADGGISHGMFGTSLVVENATWTASH
jgi:hypothetical protein